MKLLILIVCYLPSIVFARVGHSKQSYCLDEIKSGAISLGCPNNQLIKLGRVIYGYSWSNDCSYIDKDCTMDVPHEDIICLTTTNCTVRVVEHPLILQDCWNLAASYVQAEYECIAEYSLQNVCQPQDTTLTYGFLSTPNYPHGFGSNLNCPCALFASPGHAIVLEVIDFRLPTCAEAGLILWLGQDFQTKCLTQDPLTVVSNVQQNVTLRFYTLSPMKHGGFLIKYSVLPVSNNATVRLQCYLAPAVNRAPASANLPPADLSQQSPVQMANKNNGMSVPVDHERREGENAREEPPSASLVVTHSNDLIKRFPSGHDVVPPILGTLTEDKDVTKLAGINQQQPSQGFNQSTYRKHLFPNSTSSRRSNMTLIVVCVVAVVIFLLIMINALIWFIFSLRPARPKPTSSRQNLYPPAAQLGSEPKTSVSTYPTPLQHRREHSQSSARLDESLIMSNQFLRHDRGFPQDAASNRLKTLRSLLFRGHKTLGIDSEAARNRYSHNRDLESMSSECPIRSVSHSITDSQPPKSRYEEQEGCVELKSEYSFLTNRNQSLPNKNKSSQEPRQINSWDDI